jgi:hypothetical protein
MPDEERLFTQFFRELHHTDEWEPFAPILLLSIQNLFCGFVVLEYDKAGIAIMPLWTWKQATSCCY